MSRTAPQGGTTDRSNSPSPFGRGPGSLGMTLPAEKARDFSGSLRRLLSMLKPERMLIFIVR